MTDPPKPRRVFGAGPKFRGTRACGASISRPSSAEIFMDLPSESVAWLSQPDGSVTIGYGPFEESPVPPEAGIAFYVQDFAMKCRQPWKIPSRHERLERSELVNGADRLEAPAIAWKPLDAGPFSLIFQEIASSIHAGIFEKTVPVVTETGSAECDPGPAIFAAMIRQSAPLHSYGWIQGEKGFAGATPELLFSLRGLHLETMALAGTARSDDRDVFAVDQKEIREHEYVAQTLVSKFFDLGQVHASARQILNLGSIVHFLTAIQVDLDQQLTPTELIRRLHPTPALGPLPRHAQTMAMLLDWRDRLGCPDHFGAPFGLWDNGAFQAVVAIRGLWWNGMEIQLPTGCGIIEASRLVNEWRELRLKRAAVRRCLFPQETPASER